MRILTASNTEARLVLAPDLFHSELQIRLEKAEGRTLWLLNIRNFVEFDEFMMFVPLHEFRKRLVRSGFTSDEAFIAIGKIALTWGQVRRNQTFRNSQAKWLPFMFEWCKLDDYFKDNANQMEEYASMLRGSK